MRKINEHLSKGIIKVEGLCAGSDEVLFYCKDGFLIKMYHKQDCCENVIIESVDSEINNNDIYTDCSTCFMTETAYSDTNNDDDSFTWTFYNVKTNKGYDTIRWYGESNGYYSESVDFEIIEAKTLVSTLQEIKKIKIGGHFYFGEYQGVQIEWIKIADDRAISTYILDDMAFGKTNDYDTSNIRNWCNTLCHTMDLENDTIYIPSKNELKNWFPDNKLRKCDYSNEAKKRGIDDGAPWYWISTAASHWRTSVGCVQSSGAFYCYVTRNSNIGARPALKLGD